MPALPTINDIEKLPKLNLPYSDIQIRMSKDGFAEIFDNFRKKFVLLTNEEWVRQNFALYLANYQNYPASRIKLEHHLIIAGKSRRCDIVYFNKQLYPEMIVECKSVKIKLTRTVFDQISLYNSALSVKYLIVTNGLVHFAAEIDYDSKKYIFLDNIPEFNSK